MFFYQDQVWIVEKIKICHYILPLNIINALKDDDVVVKSQKFLSTSDENMQTNAMHLLK